MGLQFIAAAGTVRGLGAFGKLDAAPLVWSQASKFLLVPFVFEVAIFTNIKLLQALATGAPTRPDCTAPTLPLQTHISSHDHSRCLAR